MQAHKTQSKVHVNFSCKTIGQDPNFDPNTIKQKENNPQESKVESSKDIANLKIKMVLTNENQDIFMKCRDNESQNGVSFYFLRHN